MPSLRTASFWLAALVLPGGLLLLAPRVIRLAKTMAAKKELV